MFTQQHSDERSNKSPNYRMGSKVGTRQEVDHPHIKSKYLHECILKVMNDVSTENRYHIILHEIENSKLVFVVVVFVCVFLFAHVNLFCFCSMSTEIALLANSSIESLKMRQKKESCSEFARWVFSQLWSNFVLCGTPFLSSLPLFFIWFVFVEVSMTQTDNHLAISTNSNNYTINYVFSFDSNEDCQNR